MTHVNERARKSREKKRRAGLRLIQLWVPDTRAPGFAEEAKRQCELVAESDKKDTQLWQLLDEALEDMADDWPPLDFVPTPLDEKQ